MIDSAARLVALTLGVAGILTAVWSAYKWAWPAWQAKRKRARDIDVVLLGRLGTPPNPITGEVAQAAVPSIGQQVADLTRFVMEIHHETHNNDGSSIKDAVGRLENAVGTVNERLAAGERRFDKVDNDLATLKGQVGDELSVSNGALANAAEASKVGLRAIETAILAQPPNDLD